MTTDALHELPEDRRDIVRSAFTTAFGSTPTRPLRPLAGGASGALIYRFDAAGQAYLLRLETRRDALRNPHQHACMQAAADAGVAPPLHHVDEAAGITIMDFVESRPLSEYPGGPGNLALDLGRLIARLQATLPFPAFLDYPAVLERMLGYLRGSGAFAAGLLDPHLEAFECIRAVYPWDAAAQRSSHNDPNPNNILFDGQRLWLIDWETAFKNDPMVDLAILADNFAGVPELQEELLRGWSGQGPNPLLRARLTLLRPLTRLYYAGLIFAIVARGGVDTGHTHTDLRVPTPTEFRAALAEGRLKMGAPDTMRTFARMMLAGFLAGASGPEFESALAVVRTG